MPDWTAHNARRSAQVAESKALLQNYHNAARRATTPKWQAIASQAKAAHAEFCISNLIYNPLCSS